MRRITSNILQAFEHHPCIFAVNTVSTNLINSCCKVYSVKPKKKKRKKRINHETVNGKMVVNVPT